MYTLAAEFHSKTDLRNFSKTPDVSGTSAAVQIHCKGR